MPGSPVAHVVAVVVDDLELGDRPDAADGAGVLQPVLGRRGRAAALGRAVVLPDHRAPPVEHLALHVDRARRRGVDRPPHRRHVVLRLHVVGELQHPVELRRHHVRVRAAVPLDLRQRLLRVPLVHEDDRVARVQRVARERRDRGVVVRRRAEVHVVVPRLDAEQAEERGEQLGRDVGVEAGELALHALRPAGGARRVVHRRAGGAVVGQRVGLLGEPGVEVPEAGDGADREPGLGRDPGLVGGRDGERRRSARGVTNAFASQSFRM